MDKALALQVKELELLGADAKVITNVQNKRGITGLQNFCRTLKIKNSASKI